MIRIFVRGRGRRPLPSLVRTAAPIVLGPEGDGKQSNVQVTTSFFCWLPRRVAVVNWRVSPCPRSFRSSIVFLKSLDASKGILERDIDGIPRKTAVSITHGNGRSLGHIFVLCPRGESMTRMPRVFHLFHVSSSDIERHSRILGCVYRFHHPPRLFLLLVTRCTRHSRFSKEIRLDSFKVRYICQFQ